MGTKFMSNKTEKQTALNEAESKFANPDELKRFLQGALLIIDGGNPQSLEEISLALVAALNMAVGRGDEIEELAEKINEDLTSQGN